MFLHLILFSRCFYSNVGHLPCHIFCSYELLVFLSSFFVAYSYESVLANSETRGNDKKNVFINDIFVHNNNLPDAVFRFFVFSVSPYVVRSLILLTQITVAYQKYSNDRCQTVENSNSNSEMNVFIFVALSNSKLLSTVEY